VASKLKERFFFCEKLEFPWFIAKKSKKYASEKRCRIQFSIEKVLRFMIFFVLLTKREILHNTNQGLHHGPRASAKLINSSINLN
jgi:hypothetical protein